MKIVILPSARDDLAGGFRFYENQEKGLGDYFLESLFSDIDSLRLYAGIHRVVSVRIACCQNGSLTRFTKPKIQKRFLSKPCWTAGGNQCFTGKGWREPFQTLCLGVLAVQS